MKEKLTGMKRIKAIINSDRFKSSDCFMSLLQKDLSKVFSDYFDFRTKPDVVIIKDSGGYVLELKLPVDRIKAFGVT
jgi:hypothetical protein